MDNNYKIIKIEDLVFETYRVMAGGHDVPTDKIVSRYYKSLDMIKKVFPLCDRLNIYDNSGESPIRIFKKRNDQITFFENPY